MHDMKCMKCTTVYKASTYKLKGIELYYRNILEQPYFMSTGDTVFSAEFLHRCDIDIFRKAASFESLAYAYNDEHVGKDWMLCGKDVAILDRRRLAEGWYRRAYIMSVQRYNIKIKIEYLTSEKLDLVLEEHVEALWCHFTKEWSSERHTNNCGNRACSKALILDGHMKGTRSVCAERKCGTKVSEELGDVIVGCKKTPAMGSFFCKEHITGHNDLKSINEKPVEEENKEEGSSEIVELTCNAMRDKVLSNKYKTAGICAAVYNCGIITGITELYGSESLSQVYIFIVWLVKTMLEFPHLLAYDDGCHLKKFVCNPIRCDKKDVAKFIATLKIVVDKMHFCNHVDKWCRRNVNPYTDDAFIGINTEACEQTFHFISKYKYATKHMSYGRYNMFMLHLSII